jgi:hypothetical protein
MSRDIKPSETAFEKVRRMARRAFKKDGWMTPCVEEEDSDDINEMVLNHRDHWMETNHWEYYYSRPISDIVDTQERRFSGDLTWEERYYGLFEPLVEAFWDEWENKWDIYSLAKKALEEKKCTT